MAEEAVNAKTNLFYQQESVQGKVLESIESCAKDPSGIKRGFILGEKNIATSKWMADY